MPKAVPHVLKDYPNYSGPAVYSLVDDNGKRYIGSTNDLQTRLKMHEFGIRQILREGVATFASGKFTDAVLSGHSFRVELLATFPCGISRNELLNIERACLLAAGGLEHTYNVMNIKLRKC